MNTISQGPYGPAVVAVGPSKAIDGTDIRTSPAQPVPPQQLAEALALLAAKTDELIKHLQSTGRLQPCFNLPALTAAKAVLASVEADKE